MFVLCAVYSDTENCVCVETSIRDQFAATVMSTAHIHTDRENVQLHWPVWTDAPVCVRVRVQWLSMNGAVLIDVKLALRLMLRPFRINKIA